MLKVRVLHRGNPLKFFVMVLQRKTPRNAEGGSHAEIKFSRLVLRKGPSQFQRSVRYSMSRVT